MYHLAYTSYFEALKKSFLSLFIQFLIKMQKYSKIPFKWLKKKGSLNEGEAMEHGCYWNGIGLELRGEY